MVKFEDVGLPKEGALYVATTSVRLYSVNVLKGDVIGIYFLLHQTQQQFGQDLEKQIQ